MGLPSKKRTPRSRDDRRSHHALKKITVKTCPNCGEKLLAHRACTKCGNYKGKKVVSVEKRVQRQSRNKKAIKN
ncbi:MAG: 50S ribosomal protein L32 [Patescibacteria group bacterium]